MTQPTTAVWNEPGSVGITAWMDPLLVTLSLGLLTLSIFSGPRLSGSSIAVLLALSALGVYTIRANGSTTERVRRQRLLLFVVILVNAHLVSLSNPVLVWRLTVIQVQALLAVLGFALLLIRSARVGTFQLIRSPLDLTVLVLFLLVSFLFVGLYGLLRLNALPLSVKPDLLWIILVATLLYYILGSVLDTDAAIKQGLSLALIPLVSVCVSSSLSFWLLRSSWLLGWSP